MRWLGLLALLQGSREVAELWNIWQSCRENYVGSEALVLALALLCQCNVGRVSRPEMTSRREKSGSPEVGTILFTNNNFCSAMKEIDPALALIHKLPLMKLLELLRGADESGLVTVLPH